MTTPGTEADPYHPLIDLDGAQYFPEPYSVPRLSTDLSTGLIPVAVFATLSVASTFALITFMSTWLCSSRRQYRTRAGYNQYVVLVLNLLLADLQQSSAFLISWYWIRKNQILAPHPACFAQGWLLHSGDVGSGFFVLAIAIHTWYGAVYSKLPRSKTFAWIVAAIWVAVYFLTVIGVALHGYDKYFTAAGAWCWVSPAFEVDRLWSHYVWIFIIQFVTILIYLATFITLRKRSKKLLVDGEVPANGPNADTIKSIKRITNLMTIYPCVYILLTLPLSAGRMWTMSNGGQPTSELFSCVGGSFITSCGWVDTLLYTLTRKQLLEDTALGRFYNRTSTRLEAEEEYDKNIMHRRSVTVQSGRPTASEIELDTLNDSSSSGDDAIRPVRHQRPLVTTHVRGGLQAQDELRETSPTITSRQIYGRRLSDDAD